MPVGGPDTGWCCHFLRGGASAEGRHSPRVRVSRGDGQHSDRNPSPGASRDQDEAPPGAAAACCCLSDWGGQSWIKPTVAVGIEGVQFRLPMQELECPQSRRDQFCQIPPHGMPNYKCHCLGCHSAPSLSGQTSSHCLLIPEMAHFWSNPFLGDLVLMLRETQQLPSPQPCLSLLCCSRWAVLRWDKGCCSSSVPPCPRHKGGSVTRASGVRYFGIWSVPARNRVLRNCCN